MASKYDALKQEVDKLKEELEDKRKKVFDCKMCDAVSNVAPIGKFDMKLRKTMRGHLAKVYAIDWDDQSINIVSASQDGKLIIWNALTCLKSCAIPLRSSWVMTCCYSPSGNFVASGGLDNICTIYNLMGNDNKPRIQTELHGHQGYISSCKFIQDSRIVTASGDSSCILWDVESSKKLQELSGHASDVMKLAIKPLDPNIIATGSCDRTCKIWDLRLSSPCIQSFSTHTDDINAVSFFPKGTAVVTASDDGTARLYDLTADQELSVFNFQTSDSKVACTSCDFSASGRLLFVGLDNNTISVRDTLIGKTVGRFADHENKVSCLCVSPNGMALCSGSWDNFIRIFA